MDSSFGIELVEGDQSLILRVSGEVDLFTAPLLQKQLELAEARDPVPVLVDIEQVEFMDSSALQVLITHTASNGNATCFRLTQGSPQVRHLFEVAGLLDRLPFASD